MRPYPFQLVLASVLLAPGVPGAALAQTGYSQEEQFACEGDAFRLCLSSIPDEAQVETCFKAHLAELSPACRRMVDPPPPPRHRKGKRS
jgi:hypothetical protein